MKKVQVVEWLENPVTEFLLKEVKKEVELIRHTPATEVLVVGEPNKTHENVVNLEARLSVWEDWVDFLSGDWDLFEDKYEDE